MAIDFELEVESLLSPHEKLEYKEYKELTAKFKKWAEKRENKELTPIQLYFLISDVLPYQQKYREMIGEMAMRDCIKIYLAVEPSVLEDKNVIKSIKSWRLI